MFLLSSHETRMGLCEDTCEWLDRILGTENRGTKLKIAGAQTLFFCSDIINLGWVVAFAKKNDDKFLPVCSSWRCQLKYYLPRLVPSGWDGTPWRQKYPSNLLQSHNCAGESLFPRGSVFLNHPHPAACSNGTAHQSPSKLPPLPRQLKPSPPIRHAFTAMK